MEFKKKISTVFWTNGSQILPLETTNTVTFPHPSDHQRWRSRSVLRGLISAEESPLNTSKVSPVCGMYLARWLSAQDLGWEVV